MGDRLYGDDVFGQEASSVFDKARNLPPEQFDRIVEARRSLERLAEQVKIQNEFQKLPFVEDTIPKPRFKYMFPTDYDGSGYFNPPTLDSLRRFVPNIGVAPARPSRVLNLHDVKRWQEFINNPGTEFKL